MRIVEPYNGDQASDSILQIQVPGTGAGDCVLRLNVLPGPSPTKYWDIRLDNDVDDRLIFGYGGGTALVLGTDGGMTGASASLSGGIYVNKAAGTTISKANADFYFADETLGAGLLGQQKLSSPYQFVIQAQNIAGDTMFPLDLNPTGGAVRIGSLNLTAPKGTGTFTPVLGSLSPASTLQPTWIPMSAGTLTGYVPFFPA